MWYRLSHTAVFFVAIGLVSPRAAFSQTSINGFGHLEFNLDQTQQLNTSFGIGEHDLFVNSRLHKKIQFLGEYVVRFNRNSPTFFLPSIERSLVNINYTGKHNLIIGKIHTPLNYWNDTYHHGRIFFPTIDRPLAFSYIIPLHTLGLQMQGQNLGKYNFGYDLVVGNGINSTDFTNSGTNLSATLAIHFKPFENSRFGVSHFMENTNTLQPGAHSGHAGVYPHYTGERYAGPMSIQLTSASAAFFGQKFEFLNEFAYHRTKTDSLGVAHNFSNFTYLGYRLNDVAIPYACFDIIHISDNDLYVHPLDIYKVALGYRHEISYLFTIKAQVEHMASFHKHANPANHTHIPPFGFRIQFAYGF